MKAIERITKYGLKKYLMSSRKMEITQPLIEWYQNRYGQDIPLDKVVRYRQSFWHIEMERDEETWSGDMASAAHMKPDDNRDCDEAFRNAQKEAGETGWVLTYAKKLGNLRPIYHGEGTFVEKKVVQKILPVVVESLQQKRDSIALSLKRAGYSASEVVKALMEVDK